MDFLIPSAVAADAAGGAAPAGNPMMSMVMLLVFVLIFYFMLWRPQSKRAKEHRSMVDGLQKGDEVITSGGIVGKITGVTDTFINVKVSDSQEMTFQKHAVTSVLPKGTFKEAVKKS